MYLYLYFPLGRTKNLKTSESFYVLIKSDFCFSCSIVMLPILTISKRVSCRPCGNYRLILYEIQDRRDIFICRLLIPSRDGNHSQSVVPVTVLFRYLTAQLIIQPGRHCLFYINLHCWMDIKTFIVTRKFCFLGVFEMMF